MTRRMTYQTALACMDVDDPEDGMDLARHMEGCAECRTRAKEYGEQVQLMRALRREMPPPDVRQAVLAKAAEAPAGRQKRRGGFSKRVAACVAVAALALGGVVTNTPLPHVIAQTLGWESTDSFNASGLRCFKDGYGISRHYPILQSPSQFDPGPNGSFNQGAMQMVSEDLDHPLWFVYDGGGLLTGTCTSASVSMESIEVAINPDANTELIAIGIKKSGS